MGKQRELVFLFNLVSLSAFLAGILTVEASSHHIHNRLHNCRRRVGLSKLFVFGDSYVDTGNNLKSESSSWKEPYGITFPGKPAGRFSDGRVLTDYIASFIGIKSPIPYRWRKYGRKLLQYGLNFAYGGTGVFDTLVPGPNMTMQINFLQQLLHLQVYNKSDLASSLALISLAGNDYYAYKVRNGTAQGFPSFITSVINQLALNLKRIHGMGVKKVAVMALEPLGCLPQNAALSSYQQCNGTLNTSVKFHNLLLQKAVEKLNDESKDSAFMILDLYSAFMSVFSRRGDHPGSLKFDEPLKPCCVGLSDEYSCGSVDGSGVKKYTICENPKSAFFWDSVHPSQEGWQAVYSALQASLCQLYN